MNSITEEQNAPKQLQRLAAQRHLYSIAKKVFGAQVILGVPVAIAWSFLVLSQPEVRSYAAFWGVLVSLADVLWLNPWQKRLRESAAKAQEAFDCDVLQLPWNEIKTGKRLDPEFIKEQADKYDRTNQNYPTLNDWYSRAVNDLPLAVARTICQRTNCWWDSKQRRSYALLVIGGLVFVCVTVLGLGFIGGMTVEKFFLAIVAPLLPAIILGIRQYSEQMEAASRLDKLKEHAEQIWADALSKPTSPDLIAKSRSLQDEIYENRKRSPLVFDWVFRRLRSDYEVQMNHGAEQLAEEAKEKLGIS